MWYSRILYCRYRREMPRYSAVFSRLPPQAASAARTVSRFSAAVLRTPGRDGTATSAIMEQLNAEMEQHIKEGTSTFPAREEYRVSWDGIPCASIEIDQQNAGFEQSRTRVQTFCELL